MINKVFSFLKKNRSFLFPFNYIYYIIITIRNFLYDYNLIKIKKFQIPIIVIGNISVGGTGKTPHVEYIVNKLKNEYTLAILSRGYKRNTKGFYLLNKNSNFLSVGDEPMQYYNKFKKNDNILVAVCENRIEGIKKILKIKKVDFIILDDGFQYRKIKSSLNIVLLDYNKLPFKDKLLPVGNLREPISSLNRSDIIVLSKCYEHININNFNKHILKKNKIINKILFKSSIIYNDNISNYYNDKIFINKCKKFNILLVTGIAYNDNLIDFISKNFNSFKELKYEDHYNFTNKDINIIYKIFTNPINKFDYIITTEKDFSRLYYILLLQNNFLILRKLYFIKIKIKFYNKNQFLNIIKTYIQNYN